MKEIKKQDAHLIGVELNELKKLIPLAIEYKNLLKELEVSSVSEFELKVNEKTKFVNAMLSSQALGFESQYKKLLQLEKALDGKLSLEDLTSSNKLKPAVIDKITDKNTLYFTDDEIVIRKELNRIKESFNALDYDARRSVFIDRSFKIVFNPYSVYK